MNRWKQEVAAINARLGEVRPPAFKVGDRVRVIGEGKTRFRFGWTNHMADLMGKVGVVDDRFFGGFEVRFGNARWNFHSSSLEKVEEEPLFEGEFWLNHDDRMIYGHLTTEVPTCKKPIRVRVTEIRE